MFNRIGALTICILCMAMCVCSGYSAEAEALNGMEQREVTVDPIDQSEGYSSVLYDNNNGLPTAEANAIVETKDGFIWIGSYSGLIRYDGNSFERLNIQGLASVISLYVDSHDRLWVGTNDNGVVIIEQNNYQLFTKADGLPASSVRAILEDRNGDIYIATSGGIAIIDSSMKIRVISDPQIRTAYVKGLRMGKNGIIYGVTIEGNIFTIERGEVSGFYSCQQLGIEGIITVLPDPEQDGYLYFGTENSTIYYGNLDNSDEEFEQISIEPLSYVKNIEIFGDEMWICTDNGIGMQKGDRFQNLENVPLNNSVEQAMVDYQGNLWFVSSRQGAMKIVRNQFFDIFKKYNLPPRVVNSTCIKDGMLFIGTDTGLIVIDENAGCLLKELPIRETITSSEIEETDLIRLLNGIRIRSIIRDSKGKIWFSTWKKWGLLCWDNGVLTVYDDTNGLPSKRIRAVYERKNGEILVACTGGVAIISEGKVTKVYGQTAGIENTEILTVCEASNGDIVLGTDGGGIYVISGSKTTHIGTSAGLISEVIMRVKPDLKNNVIWLVTSNSLAYMDEHYKVSTIKNFPYSNNFDLYEDNMGNMWVLASDGVYVASTEEMLVNEEIHAVHYGVENGLTYMTTGNSYSELSEGGNLYIAGTNGVARVNINSPLESVNDVKVEVPFIGVNGEIVFPDDSGKFTIPQDTYKLTIYCYSFTYSLFNPEISYYLKGFETNETLVSRKDLAPIDYTNLKGGTYFFVVTLKDSMGRGDSELSVAIVKEKAFYETIWFYISAAIIMILCLAATVRFYTRRKLKKYQKKDEENRAIIRGITKAFAKVIDMKDKYTNGHSFRVAEYTAMLAKEMGYSEQEIDKYYNIALLHDIGKIGIPEEVLNKQGKLTEEEFKTIKSHTSLGYEALKEITIMPELADGAGYHHERPDGRGYNHLKENEIPRVAQIISVADAFDAMYSNRPYRNRMNFEKVCSIIKEGVGKQFSEDVVEAFFRLVGKGKFRAPDDFGSGSEEEINNVG